MNDTNNHELVGYADTMATLLAANNGLPFDADTPAGDGEAAHEEGAFISDDADEAVVSAD